MKIRTSGFSYAFITRLGCHTGMMQAVLFGLKCLEPKILHRE